jgi:hypothetical protein
MVGRLTFHAALRCRVRLRDIFFLGTAMSSTPSSRLGNVSVRRTFG